jgi:hypothetical protein
MDLQLLPDWTKLVHLPVPVLQPQSLPPLLAVYVMLFLVSTRHTWGYVFHMLCSKSLMPGESGTCS